MPTRGRWRRGAILMAMAVGLWLSPRAGAITWRDDLPESTFVNLATQAKYASVGRVNITRTSGNFVGSGILIGPDWVLTAAHCADDASTSPDGDVTALSFTDSTGATTVASSWLVHDSWTGDLTEGWDIALIQLSSPINGIAPATLYTGSSELGHTSTMVGYGTAGTGLTGNTLPPGNRRAGQNVIDLFGGSGALVGWSERILFSDFDQPGDPSESLFGSSTPIGLEASIAPGDSGGGTFIDSGGSTYLVGVHSLGASVDGNTNSDYGDVFGSIRVGQFSSWITAQTGLSVGSAPEPQCLALLATVHLAFYLTGRRRRTA